MIRLAYPVHPTKGYSVDLSCPVVVCDVCSELIDSAHPGLLVWSASVAPLHVHKGRCDQAAEARHGHLLSREVDVWLDQLVRNYEQPLIGAHVTLDSGDTITVGAVRLTEPGTQAKSREDRVAAATFALAQARLGREPDAWDWPDVTDEDRRRAELLVDGLDA